MQRTVQDVQSALSVSLSPFVTTLLVGTAFVVSFTPAQTSRKAKAASIIEFQRCSSTWAIAGFIEVLSREGGKGSNTAIFFGFVVVPNGFVLRMPRPDCHGRDIFRLGDHFTSVCIASSSTPACDMVVDSLSNVTVTFDIWHAGVVQRHDGMLHGCRPVIRSGQNGHCVDQPELLCCTVVVMVVVER